MRDVQQCMLFFSIFDKAHMLFQILMYFLNLPTYTTNLIIDTCFVCAQNFLFLFLSFLIRDV